MSAKYTVKCVLQGMGRGLAYLLGGLAMLGSPLSLSAAVHVAAANSSDAAKSAADFVCTGTNDEAVLTKAIETLVRGGTLERDEGCAHLPHFSGRGHLTAVDFNIERFNADYIPDDPDGGREHAAQEAEPGSWHGFISYTMQGKAFGLKRFWADGSGVNFRTENLDHSRTSRPSHPEYLETYFDKATNKTLTWNGAIWVDAMGNPAPEQLVKKGK